MVEAKQIQPNAGDALDIGQLRATHGDTYADYLERKVSQGQEEVQPKSVMEKRTIAPDCQCVLITDYVAGQCVKNDQSYYICTQTHRAGAGFDGDRWVVSPVWTSQQRYVVNEHVTYEGEAYHCIEDHVSTEVFNRARWELTDSYWQANTEYQENQCVRVGNVYYICVASHRSGTSFGFDRWSLCAAWQSQTTYAQGDCVQYGDRPYQCTQSHRSTSVFDASSWQLLEVSTGVRWGVAASIRVAIAATGGAALRCGCDGDDSERRDAVQLQ